MALSNSWSKYVLSCSRRFSRPSSFIENIDLAGKGMPADSALSLSRKVANSL